MTQETRGHEEKKLEVKKRSKEKSIERRPSKEERYKQYREDIKRMELTSDGLVLKCPFTAFLSCAPQSVQPCCLSDVVCNLTTHQRRNHEMQKSRLT